MELSEHLLPCPVCGHSVTPPQCSECGTYVELRLCPRGAVRVRPLLVWCFAVAMSVLLWFVALEIARAEIDYQDSDREFQRVLTAQLYANNAANGYIIALRGRVSQKEADPFSDYESRRKTFFADTNTHLRTRIERYRDAIKTPIFMFTGILIIAIAVVSFRRCTQFPWILTRKRYVLGTAIILLVLGQFCFELVRRSPLW